MLEHLRESDSSYVIFVEATVNKINGLNGDSLPDWKIKFKRLFLRIFNSLLRIRVVERKRPAD